MTSPFYAYVSRMKYIKRWGLMRNTQSENDMEHSFQVALVAHSLAAIGNARFNKNNDCEHVLALAFFHDVSEVITGDLPMPVKYQNPYIQVEYKKVEALALEKLTSMLPEDLQPFYSSYLKAPNPEELPWQYVKAADTLCAYIKCLEEEKAGNHEFSSAKASLYASLKKNSLKEVDVFIAELLPSFSMTLDELSRL